MMITPMADSSLFNHDPWRTPKTPQLEAQLLGAVPQFSLHPPPVTKTALGIVPNLNTYRFLIVDDNEINLRIFRRVLKRLFPNSSIDTIQDSCQVEYDRLSQYKIAFLDIEMPMVTGVDIAKMVRSKSSLDNLGLVAVTTRNSAADLKLYEETGFDLMIAKPVHRGYSGILRDIEGVLEDRCGDDSCVRDPAPIGAGMRSAVLSDLAVSGELAPELVSDSDCTSGSSSASSSASCSRSCSGSMPASGTLPKSEAVFRTSRAAATSAVSDLLVSVAQCDPATF
ncbi:hypothetical protein JCM33374_g1458 [Metschnikowia sp. JCM 33374]|nr:hypothetical protein JCM33374_g1458 [Metschnikowia sp. JCM 33374]